MRFQQAICNGPALRHVRTCHHPQMSEGKIVPGQTTVVVHPLVLLSVVDHYNRACKAAPRGV